MKLPCLLTYSAISQYNIGRAVQSLRDCILCHVVSTYAALFVNVLWYVTIMELLCLFTYSPISQSWGCTRTNVHALWHVTFAHCPMMRFLVNIVWHLYVTYVLSLSLSIVHVLSYVTIVSFSIVHVLSYVTIVSLTYSHMWRLPEYVLSVSLTYSSMLRSYCSRTLLCNDNEVILFVNVLC